MDKKHLKELKKSLKKCLSPLEKPYKLEHAITVVLKTYDLQNSEAIWTFGANLTLNRFTTWKFCCLMHEVLNKGHVNCLRDALKYDGVLRKTAHYWSCTRNDQMSLCIVWYCKVLSTKISFHKSYGNFVGNLEIKDDLVLRDINICFQLCLDIFDYLETLLHLQRVIFANIEHHQISVASKKGMCRLTSLVTIIAECNLLYQHSITILRLLHLQLYPDDISGLCDRFNEIFQELQMFYAHVRAQRFPSDYFLAIPELPRIQPNFYGFERSHDCQQQQLQQQLQEQHEPSAPDLISFL